MTFGLTACTLASALGPTPSNKYGKPLLFTTHLTACCKYHFNALHVPLVRELTSEAGKFLNGTISHFHWWGKICGSEAKQSWNPLSGWVMTYPHLVYAYWWYVLMNAIPFCAWSFSTMSPLLAKFLYDGFWWHGITACFLVQSTAGFDMYWRIDQSWWCDGTGPGDGRAIRVDTPYWWPAS